VTANKNANTIFSFMKKWYSLTVDFFIYSFYPDG